MFTDLHVQYFTTRLQNVNKILYLDLCLVPSSLIRGRFVGGKYCHRKIVSVKGDKTVKCQTVCAWHLDLRTGRLPKGLREKEKE